MYSVLREWMPRRGCAGEQEEQEEAADSQKSRTPQHQGSEDPFAETKYIMDPN